MAVKRKSKGLDTSPTLTRGKELNAYYKENAKVREREVLAILPAEADSTLGLKSAKEPTYQKAKQSPAGWSTRHFLGQSGARPASRLVDLPRSARLGSARPGPARPGPSGARPAGRPSPRQWEGKTRRGPACASHVRNTEVTAATRRAQPAPRPPLAPPGKGDGGAALRRPRTLVRATPLPPSPVPAPRARRARGGEAEGGRSTPRPGGAVRGAPPSSPPSLLDPREKERGWHGPPTTARGPPGGEPQRQTLVSRADFQ